MSVHIELLKAKVVQENTTLEAVAQILGVNRSTLYRKLQNGGKNLTVAEARQISNFLHLEQNEQLQIFWND